MTDHTTAFQHLRKTVQRGGHMAKCHGQIVQLAPLTGTVTVPGLLSSVAPFSIMATAMIGLATPVAAQCTGGPSTFTCSGLLTAEQTFTNPTLDINLDETFSINTSSGNALNLRNDSGGTGNFTLTQAPGGGDIIGAGYGIRVPFGPSNGVTITTTGTVIGNSGNGISVPGFISSTGDIILNVNEVRGSRYGIRAQNAGTGSISITASGIVEGGSNSGLSAFNANVGEDVVIDTAAVTRGGFGLIATNNGSGILSLKAREKIIGTERSGIEARNYGTDLTLNVTSVSGGPIGRAGILAINGGENARSLYISATGAVTAESGYGIDARNNGTDDLTLNVTSVSGDRVGVRVNNRGESARRLSLSASGDVMGNTGQGINASNYGTDLSLDVTNVTGGTTGISARNRGTGDLSITSSGAIIGESEYGLRVVNYGEDLRLNVASVTGQSYGIQAGYYAGNYGRGHMSIVATGTVAGTTRDGMYARNSSDGTGMTVSAADVTGGRDGIRARNYGSGALSVTASGDVTGQAGYGIYAYNSANDTTASMLITRAAGTTTMGAIDGIYANNLGGSLTIEALGTSIGTTRDGIRAVNDVAGTTTSSITVNNATGGVNGLYARNNPTGLQSITVTGTVTGGTGYGIDTGTGLGGITEITLNAGADVRSTAGLGIFNDAGDSNIVVNTGAKVAGVIRLNDGSDNLTFAGGDFSGVTLFDGGDDISALPDGFVDVLTFAGSSGALDGANVQNWEEVVIDDGSTISFNDGILTTGTLSTMGTGVLDASGGGFELTGNLSNDGRTTMQEGAAGDMISVSGDYAGTGILLVDTDFATDASDVLVVGGDITGGTTQIMVADVSTGAASGNDVVVVDVARSTAPGDFALAGGPITSGVFDYELELADRQWVLAGALNPTGAVYEALPLVLGGFNRLPTLKQRVHQRSSTERQPLWLRLTGNRLNATPSSMSGLSYDSDQWGLQAGADVALEPGAAGQWVIGATVQYGQISAGVQNALGTGSIDAEGYGVGATATYYGNTGVYVDLQGQMNWITSDIASSVSGDLATDRDSRAYAVSAEVGQSIALSQGGSLIPQAQLTWGRVKGDSFTDAAGNAVVPGDNESLVGRLGLAYQSNETESGQFHIIGNLLHDFSGAQTTQANATGLSASGANTWAEFGIGGHVELAPNQMLYGEASYRSSLNGGGNSALSLSVGFRMDF